MTEEKKNVKVKVFRFDPTVDKDPRYITYEIPYDKVIEEKMSVLTALLYIYENLDGSISFQYSCRGGDCHCCDVIVNGKAVEACSERVTGDITIEPPIQAGFKVVKDLIATDIFTTDEDHFATRTDHVWNTVESLGRSDSVEQALIKLLKGTDRESFSEEKIARQLGISRERVSSILKEIEMKKKEQ